MKIVMRGHECRYALEQILLILLKDEKPVFAESVGPGDDCFAISRLTRGKRYVTVITEMACGGVRTRTCARERIPDTIDPFDKERHVRYAVKRSFYLAACSITGKTPPWGSLTGIRPGKVATRLLEEGKSERAVERELENRFFVSTDRARLCIETAQYGIQTKKSLKPDEISLYIGIPFCPTRCVYCSFVSNSVLKAAKLIPDYLDALEREIESGAETVRALGLRVKAVYFGGGTPTSLTASQLDRLQSCLERCFDLSGVTEYTVEAGRPDTIDEEKLACLKRHGVTRVSINPQSLSDEVLAAIGRAHTAQDIFQAYAAARRSGFPVINMDVIAGLPCDSPEGFAHTLGKVIGLRPENIMVHTLALKKGSALALQGLALPDAQQVGQMLDFAQQALRAAGYRPYYMYRQKFMSGSFENTGWCLPGTQGLYNIYIMEELHTILSFGAGGVTKMVDARTAYIERIFNPKYPYEYIAGLQKILKNGEKLAGFYQTRGLCSHRI